MFSRHDDELMICIRTMSADEWRILLRWTPDAQQQLIDDFDQYVCPIA